MIPPAPGLFSTTNGWPSDFASWSATTRPRMSVAEPGVNGTMIFTGRAGYCASAEPAARRAAARSTPRRRFMRNILPLQSVHMKSRLQRTISPADGSVYAERELASGSLIETTLSRAVRSQKKWKAVPLAERAAICRRMAAWCVERADELGKELSWQMGRPVAHSAGEIRRGFAERVAYMSSIAEDSLKNISLEEKEGFHRFIQREPLGVVLVVAPWNYPWLTSVNAIVPALLAGNAVILKMAAQTPLVAERYAKAFKAAGLPDGVFQFLNLDHDQVARAIRDPRIGFVAFTGSVGGGHAVQSAAAARFVATSLELGGKDPAYVRADAPFAATVENLVDGAFFNSGQSCCGVERIYVERKVFKPFVEAFVQLTSRYRLGSPLDGQTTLGPMVRTAAADAVRQQTREAIAKGAKALIDQKALFAADRENTPYLAPQVLIDVDHGMQIMTEESF